MYVQFTYSTLLQSCRIKKNIDAYGTMIFFSDFLSSLQLKRHYCYKECVKEGNPERTTG